MSATTADDKQQLWKNYRKDTETPYLCALVSNMR